MPDQAKDFALADAQVDILQGQELAVLDLALHPADHVFLKRVDPFLRHAIRHRDILQADDFVLLAVWKPERRTMLQIR